MKGIENILTGLKNKPKKRRCDRERSFRSKIEREEK